MVFDDMVLSAGTRHTNGNLAARTDQWPAGAGNESASNLAEQLYRIQCRYLLSPLCAVGSGKFIQIHLAIHQLGPSVRYFGTNSRRGQPCYFARTACFSRPFILHRSTRVLYAAMASLYALVPTYDGLLLENTN